MLPPSLIFYLAPGGSNSSFTFFSLYALFVAQKCTYFEFFSVRSFHIFFILTHVHFSISNTFLIEKIQFCSIIISIWPECKASLQILNSALFVEIYYILFIMENYSPFFSWHQLFYLLDFFPVWRSFQNKT